MGFDCRLPTCSAVFNIYHPYDPIAYRLEPLIHRSFKDIKPVLIPHHKVMFTVNIDPHPSPSLWGFSLESLNSRYFPFLSGLVDSFEALFEDFSKFSEISRPLFPPPNDDQSMGYGQSVSAGALNSGRRIDYVLQEWAVEAFNEYLFAIRAHACYWQSEDNALLILSATLKTNRLLFESFESTDGSDNRTTIGFSDSDIECFLS